MDRILRCAHAYTLEDDGLGYLEKVDIFIDGGKIIKIIPSSQENKAEEIIDLTHHLVLPGFIDAHMHTGMNILRGLAQDTSHWMMHGLGPFAQVVSQEEELLGSKLAILEAARAGTTSFGDYETNMDEVCGFLKKMGLRGQITATVREALHRVYAPGEIYEFDQKMGEESLQRNLALFEKWNGKDKMRIFFGPQGADFLSAELLLRLQRLAKEKHTKIHTHVQQGDRETYQIQKRYGKRPVAFLKELGYLDKSLLAVHLTDCLDDEVKIVAQSGANMIFCPASIGIIDGLVPSADVFQKEGGMVALGSDQAPGNNSHNLIKEMYCAALFTKIKRQDPEAMPAWKVLRMATIEGARACGVDESVGSLEVGKQADIIAIDLRRPSMSPVFTHPMRNLVPNLVYSARGDEVDFSMVGGDIILREGSFIKDELEELFEELKGVPESIGHRAEAGFNEVAGSNYRWMKEGLL